MDIIVGVILTPDVYTHRFLADNCVTIYNAFNDREVITNIWSRLFPGTHRDDYFLNTKKITQKRRKEIETKLSEIDDQIYDILYHQTFNYFLPTEDIVKHLMCIHEVKYTKRSSNELTRDISDALDVKPYVLFSIYICSKIK